MALRFDHLDSHNGDWQCSGCGLDYSRREASKPWQTSDGVSQSLVCEACISRQFDKALRLDGCFPARLRGVELDSRHFKSLLSQNFIDGYFTRYTNTSVKRTGAQAHFLELLRCGVDYQICPGCKSATCLEDERDCKHVVCVCCLTSFCFRCGQDAKDVDLLDVTGHWNERDGCRCFPTPSAGSERDDAEVGFNEPEEESSQDTPAKLERLDAAASRFNAAMQSANARDQVLLRESLEEEKVLSGGEAGEIWTMISAPPRDREEDGWLQDAPYREQCDLEFLRILTNSRGKERDTQHECFHVLGGAYFLLKPIGGIFDMSHLQTRLTARTWLNDRITSAGATDKHNNAAIFEIHDGPDRDIAFRLLRDTLKDYVFLLPRHTISFDTLGDLVERRHLAVFVQVQERRNPQADEFTGRIVGDLNVFCGMIVNPSVDLFVVPGRPVGMYFGGGRGDRT